MADYDNRDKGVIFFRKEKKSDKAPDWGGHFELSTDTLKKLIELAKAQQPVKFNLSGWWPKDGTKGRIGLSLDTYEPKKKDNSLNDAVPF
jgi:hypothetical protein